MKGSGRTRKWGMIYTKGPMRKDAISNVLGSGEKSVQKGVPTEDPRSLGFKDLP